MVRNSILGLLAPILGLGAILLIRPFDHPAAGSAYFAWFAAAAAVQVAACLLLLRPTRRSWRRGWTLLWFACAAYMGGYSDAYLVRRALEQQRAEAPRHAGRTEATQQPAGAELEAGIEVLSRLEYLFGLLFTAAFFVLSFAAAPEAQRYYGYDPPAETAVAAGR